MSAAATAATAPHHPNKLNLIVAVCRNMGIGRNGALPWRLKQEMAYFTRMTSETRDPTKRNAVIMGRKTWDSIPAERRPLRNRINLVLTSKGLCTSYRHGSEQDSDVSVCASLDDALRTLARNHGDRVERVWVIGGRRVYESALASPYFHRLYLTRIDEDFECDTFLPDSFALTRMRRIEKEEEEEEDENDKENITKTTTTTTIPPYGPHTENGLSFTYEVYEREPEKEEKKNYDDDDDDDDEENVVVAADAPIVADDGAPVVESAAVTGDTVINVDADATGAAATANANTIAVDAVVDATIPDAATTVVAADAAIAATTITATAVAIAANPYESELAQKRRQRRYEQRVRDAMAAANRVVASNDIAATTVATADILKTLKHH